MRTIEELITMDLNRQAVEEFEEINSADTVMVFVDRHIEDLRHDNGRKIRSERRESMKKVIKILYSFLNANTGECSPSMRTIAYKLNPDIEPINGTDSYKEARTKEKLLAATLMLVQRTIKLLQAAGLIKVHLYRAETNTLEISNDNFYYEIVPVSTISTGFKAMLEKATRAMLKLSSMVKAIRDSVLAINKSTWNFVVTSIDRKIRDVDITELNLGGDNNEPINEPNFWKFNHRRI